MQKDNHGYGGVEFVASSSKHMIGEGLGYMFVCIPAGILKQFFSFNIWDSLKRNR